MTETTKTIITKTISFFDKVGNLTLLPLTKTNQLLKKIDKKTKRQLVIIPVAILILFGPLAYLLTKKPNQAKAWWNSSWDYRKAVTVTNNGSEQTDFQVAITLDTQTLINEGKMQSDCDDLRFTDTNGILLPHFISNCNSDSSKLWVKVSTIPTSTSTIYFYYGNPLSETGNSAQQTFDFTTEPIVSGVKAYSSLTSGISVSTATAENGVNPLASNYMIKFTGTITGTNNPYAYYKISDSNGEYYDNYVVQDSDFITFLVYNYDVPGVGVEINFTDGSVLRWNHEDQDNIDAMLENSNANGYWYWRYIDISDMAGKTINYISVVQEDATPEIDDTWVSYFNNIKIIQYSTDVSAENPQAEENKPIENPPKAYWKLDEGYNTQANDSTGNGYEGTISGATWRNDSCIQDNCLLFDGTDDNLTVASAISSINSIAFWIKPSTTTEAIMTLASGVTISIDSGNITTEGITEPTVYVNGAQTTSISPNLWSQVTIVTNTNITADAISIGNVSTTFLKGFLDEIKLYDYARTAAQVKTDSIKGAGSEGSSVVMGAEKTNSLSEGLVGYYKLDEASTPSLDSSGNGNSATWYNSPTSTNGKYSLGVSFPGANDYLRTGSVAAHEPENITVAAWIYATESSYNTGFISHYNGNPSHAWSYLLSNDANGKLKIVFQNGITNTLSVSSTTSIPINTWSHVAFTYEGSKVYLYINGVQDTTSANYTGGIDYNDTPSWTQIGKGDNDFPDKLDEVRIYNRALSSQEVKDLYNWAPGPVAYYDFNEKTGTETVYDKSGNGINGSINKDMTATDWVSGKFGSALHFDGNGDNIDCTNNTKFQTTAFTISGWVKPETNNDGIITKGTSRDGTTLRNWDLLQNGSNLYFIGSDDSNYLWTVTAPLLSTDAWQYVTATWDGTTNTNGVKIYVNGVRVGQGTASNTNLATDENLYIGGYGTYTFTGTLDEVKFYNYARTPKQIIEDMNAGHPIGGSPVGSQSLYYKFDEGYGDTAYDSSPQQNNGDLGGTCPGDSTCPTWTSAGKYGKALSLDGNDYIDNASISYGDSYTIEAWIKPTNLSIINNFGRTIAASSPTAASYYPLWLLVRGNQIRAYAYSDSTTNYYQDSNFNSIQTNTWYHVALSATKSGNAYLYINGQLDSTFTAGPQNANNKLTLGDLRPGRNIPFQGIIDEVKVYSAALTADQISLDYNQGKALVLGSQSSSQQEYCPPGNTEGNCAEGQDPTPKLEWKLDEKTDVYAYDSSGNNHMGDLTGSGMSWTQGIYGSAVKTTQSSRITTADSDDLTSPSFTLNFWFKWNKTQSSWPRIGKFQYDNSDAQNEYSFQFKQDDGRWYIRVNNSTVLYHQGNGQYLDTTINKWHFISITYNDNTNQLKIIQNGTRTLLNVTNDFSITNSDFAFLAYSSSSLNYDNIQYFNYARTQAQIAWDYNKGKPIAWWKLDECQGETAYDSSGNGNNGSITIGATEPQTSVGTCTTSGAWYNGVTGKFNSSLNFDAIDDYIEFGNILNMGLQDMSISCWIKTTSNNINNQFIVSKSRQAAQNFRYGVAIQNGYAKLFMQGDGGADVTFTGNVPIADTAWHFLTFIYDRNGNASIYVDGKFDTSQSISHWENVNMISNNPFRIAAYTTQDNIGATSIFDGQIDDIQIYNYALSEQQIKNIYNQNSSVRFGPSSGSPE